MFFDGFKRQLARCGDYEEFYAGHEPYEVEYGVADAWWHVNDEVVQVAPESDREQFDERVGSVCPAQGCGFVADVVN